MSIPLLRRLPIAPVVFAAVLLGAVTLAALPAVIYAQPPPPHLFAGQVDDVTINGDPWDGTLIEVIDSDGDRVAVVDRSDNGWRALVPPTAGSVRFRLGDAVSQVFTIIPGNLTQIALTLVDGGPGRSVALVTGFNFVVWTGLTMSVDDALASFPDITRISAIFEFHASTQGWLSVRPGGLAFLQGFSDLVAGRSYVFSMTGAANWTMPVDGAVAGTLNDRDRIHDHWLGGRRWRPAGRDRRDRQCRRCRGALPLQRRDSGIRLVPSRIAGLPCSRSMPSVSTMSSSCRPRPARASRSSAAHAATIEEARALRPGLSRFRVAASTRKRAPPAVPAPTACRRA